MREPQNRSGWIPILVLALLQGCASGVARIPGGEPASEEVMEALVSKHATLDKETKQPHAGSYLDVMARCAWSPDGAHAPEIKEGCAQQRNRVVNELLLAIDHYYFQYEGNLIAGRAISTFWADSSTTALSTVGAAVTNYAQVWSGLSSLLGATKTTYDKSFYEEKANGVLVIQMRSDRARLKNLLQTGMGRGYMEWPLEHGMPMVLEYYRAGTLASAMVSLSMTAGNAAKANTRTQDENFLRSPTHQGGSEEQ